ncbi:CMRF35-like molecule 6 isoform X2 [Alosa pseudoharengus]|uniref:CMRF35-like molecule 6 isoform X2 n=1 Tax=Alosa pseudoharengus TaxID=34774 RepID=UPI003F8A9C38
METQWMICCLLADKIVKTEEGQARAINGRFSLHDDTTAGVFTVTITGLTAEDSGQYWCAIKRVPKKDVYTEVELNVIKDSVSVSSPSPKLTQTSAPSPEFPSSTSPSGHTTGEPSVGPEPSPETLPNRESALTLTYWTVRVAVILSVLALTAVCLNIWYRKANSACVSEEKRPRDSTCTGPSAEGTATVV